jgi:hypothetical protein
MQPMIELGIVEARAANQNAGVTVNDLTLFSPSFTLYHKCKVKNGQYLVLKNISLTSFQTLFSFAMLNVIADSSLPFFSVHFQICLVAYAGVTRDNQQHNNQQSVTSKRAKYLESSPIFPSLEGSEMKAEK